MQDFGERFGLVAGAVGVRSELVEQDVVVELAPLGVRRVHALPGVLCSGLEDR